MGRVDPTIKGDAEFLAAALEMGVATVDEIVAWADRVILETPNPDIAICEVSLMRRSSRLRIASTLRQVEGDTDPAIVRGLLIERLIRAHEDGLVSPERVSKWMYDDAMLDAEGWAENYSEALSFWDGIDLAREGVFGHYDLKVGEMVDFLRDVAAGLLRGDGAAVKPRE